MSTEATENLELRQRVVHILERIRPAIQADGGDIEFVGLTEDGIVQIRFHGECVGCPSADMTLQHGIEKNLMDRVPEVTGVEHVP